MLADAYVICVCVCVFFYIIMAATESYTLSLHDALPISGRRPTPCRSRTSRPRIAPWRRGRPRAPPSAARGRGRSEEHTSELQSLRHLVCRLLLEKKKKDALAAGTHTILY